MCHLVYLGLGNLALVKEGVCLLELGVECLHLLGVIEADGVTASCHESACNDLCQCVAQAGLLVAIGGLALADNGVVVTREIGKQRVLDCVCHYYITHATEVVGRVEVFCIGHVTADELAVYVNVLYVAALKCLHVAVEYRHA